MEPVECFEHDGIGPGLGLDDIEEVVCVDEHLGFFLYLIDLTPIKQRGMFKICYIKMVKKSEF
jgi:hypothetical protein